MKKTQFTLYVNDLHKKWIAKKKKETGKTGTVIVTELIDKEIAKDKRKK